MTQPQDGVKCSQLKSYLRRIFKISVYDIMLSEKEQDTKLIISAIKIYMEDIDQNVLYIIIYIYICIYKV